MSPTELSDDRVHLEPVTCWPLIFGATGFVVLALTVLVSVALWNVYQPRPDRPASTGVTQLDAGTEPADEPELPPAPQAFRPEKQVIVTKIVEPDFYAPLPQSKAAVAKPTDELRSVAAIAPVAPPRPRVIEREVTPGVPYQSGGKWFVRELVRVNPLADPSNATASLLGTSALGHAEDASAGQPEMLFLSEYQMRTRELTAKEAESYTRGKR